jgi:anti-sigma-K factor RskA
VTDNIHLLTGAYALDALDDIERAQFERHLTSCSPCREELAGLQAAATALAHTSAVLPPPALRDRVLAEIATVRPLPPETRETTAVPDAAEVAETDPAQRRSRSSWSRRPGLLVAAAAAAIALGAGAAVTQPWDSGTDQTVSAADRVLTAPDAERASAPVADVSGASVTVVRSSARHEAVMVTRGVPAPPSGMVYQAWLRDADGRMVSVGLMSSVHDGRPVLLDPDQGDAATATAFAITVEPQGGSPSPTQQPLVEVRFTKA